MDQTQLADGNPIIGKLIFLGTLGKALKLTKKFPAKFLGGPGMPGTCHLHLPGRWHLGNTS